MRHEEHTRVSELIHLDSLTRADPQLERYTMKRSHLVAVGALAAIAASMLVPVHPNAAASVPSSIAHAPTFADVPSTSPERPVPMLFIHHSCGGQLLAAEGADKGDHCIYDSHPSGGGLRAELEHAGYVVHEASYGSAIGNDTDLFDWLPKFTQQMDRVLRVKKQDEMLPEGQKNEVVVFKSCFPNNQFVGEGSSPGDAHGPQLTVWNARATLAALLPELAKRPETLFVYVTAPPIAPRPEKMPLWRVLARTIKGRREPAWTAQQATWARELNDWVVSPTGWLSGYAQKNVVVFDYYGALTGDGKSNLLSYTTSDDSDSHPSAEGNRAAAAAFLPLLNRAVRRAGLVASSASAR
jgi:hypothetical protein